MKILLVFVVTFLISSSCFFQKNELTVMFYNTENFFDTIDDPHKSDNEFLPSSEKQWNTERYFNKIKNLSAVIDSVVPGKDVPALVGLCEVENETCLKDLTQNSSIKKNNYKFLITNSPDVRSIDVALLYDSKLFSLVSFKEISATNPMLPENKTRNILYAKLLFKGKETVHVFVNHWPSMRDGVENSEPRRIYAAQQLRKQIDSLGAGNKIIVMGDFNEAPASPALEAAFSNSKCGIKNMLVDLSEKGFGTHYFNKEWKVLDQIFVSGELLNQKSSGGKLKTRQSEPAGIFFNDLVLYEAPRLKIKLPNRTFTGKKYHNGYSDHLAVFLKLNY
jgi:predicted extracellular nuclease